MHLERIEAVRYGELAGEALEGLGPRLNVVLGRNEAGKSSFTSLVRHILYGFPRGRTVERQYLPPTGDQRVGRLVFADGGQRWTVERVEGAHGGEAVVHGPQGEEPADAFLESLTRGVSAGTFAAVFGFSLEQLSDPKSLDDIGSRLYATAAGLGADPNGVLTALRAEADELWAPRARTRVLQNLNSELRELRERRRKVEDGAERYRADRELRAEVAAELESLDRDVAAARRDEDRLAALLGEARRLAERAREVEEAEVEHRLAAEALRRDAGAAEVDEPLLEKAEAIEALGARCELFRSEVEQMRRDAERLRALDAQARRTLDDLGDGWSLEKALAVRLDLDLEDRVEAAEGRLAEARRHRDESERRAAEAEAEGDEAAAEARRRSRAVGVADDGGAPDEVGVRLQAVDRLLALGGGTADRSAHRVPAVASFLIAAALAAAGLAVDDRWLVIAAALPAALAAGLLLWPLIVRPGPSKETAALLRLLGVDDVPAPGALLGLKNRLEECRRLWTSAEQLGRAADARRRAADEAAAAFEGARETWSAWLLERGLATASNQPESVRRVLARLRELRDATAARRELEAQVTRRRTLAEAFVAGARALGAAGVQAGDEVFDEAWHGVRSLQGRLAAAREQLARRRRIEAEAELAEERARADAAQAARTAASLRAVLVDGGFEESAAVAELEAAAAGAERRARELEAARDELLERRATLDGRLQRGAEESRSAELRLAEAGLAERVRDGLEAYAVAAVAARLLGSSLATYEAERQPQVIRRAEEIFGRLTGRRYSRLATPLGRFEPSVAAGDGAAKPPERLSRATAEQLFLALRLSYIEHLAGAHQALPVLMDDVLVNFDDERRAAAVDVISEFAAGRQVVFFTCHQATADAFSDASGDHTVLTLQR